MAATNRRKKKIDQESLIKIFKSLSQETRLDIFLSLVRAGPKGRPAGAIAEQFDLTGPTISFHLKTLYQAGLVDSRREQQSIIYSVKFDRVVEVAQFLARNCCAGQLETKIA